MVQEERTHQRGKAREKAACAGAPSVPGKTSTCSVTGRRPGRGACGNGSHPPWKLDGEIVMWQRGGTARARATCRTEDASVVGGCMPLSCRFAAGSDPSRRSTRLQPRGSLYLLHRLPSRSRTLAAGLRGAPLTGARGAHDTRLLNE